MRRSVGAVIGLAWAALSSAACGDVSPRGVLTVDATARVDGVLFLDQNGNGQLDATDTRVKAWTVRLVALNGRVISTTVSDTLGAYHFVDVPAGEARIDLDRARLADTLVVFGSALDKITTLGRGDTVVVSAGFSYPKVALSSVDTVPPGRRILTEGIALNTLFTNGPRELHLRSGTKALRTINVVRRDVAVGDSVRVLGRRTIEAGQAVLTEVEIFPLRAAVEDPAPLALTTARAASAASGTVGADLATVRNANLMQSRNQDNDVVLTVDDGSGSLDILVRASLGADASFFNPDSIRVLQATGLLVPLVTNGQTRWRLTLRTSADLRTERKARATATATGPTSINLSATAASGGAQPFTYQWYRSTTAGFAAGADNILAGRTSLGFNDTGLAPGTTYYYRLVAIDNAGIPLTYPETSATPLAD